MVASQGRVGIRVLAFVMACVTTVSLASGQTSSQPEEKKPSTLDVGSVAPALQIASWPKGDRVNQFQRGHIYIIEFWATTCGPCLQSIPHTSALQAKYANQVTVVGITEEDRATVESFLQKIQTASTSWNDAIGFALATDDDWKTFISYLGASGQKGIPSAFIVGRDGYIEWLGDPRSMDDPLAKIVAGNWDQLDYVTKRDAAKAQFQEANAVMRRLTAAYREKRWDDAIELVDTLAKFPGNKAQMELMQKQVRAEGGRLRTEAEWQSLFDSMDKAIKAIPLQEDAIELSRLRFLHKAGRPTELANFTDKFIKRRWDTPSVLNAIAWTLAVDVQDGDLDVARAQAERACEITKYQSPRDLDTLARVHFRRGDIASAVRLQRDAIEHAGKYHDGYTAPLAEFEEALDERPSNPMEGRP